MSSPPPVPDDREWEVPARFSGGYYLVQRISGMFRCTCRVFHRDKDCEHIGYVEVHLLPDDQGSPLP